ncbi:MAG: hypothetical protein AB7F83_04040 [Lysobacterales bacterium]
MVVRELGQMQAGNRIVQDVAPTPSLGFEASGGALALALMLDVSDPSIGDGQGLAATAQRNMVEPFTRALDRLGVLIARTELDQGAQRLIDTLPGRRVIVPRDPASAVAGAPIADVLTRSDCLPIRFAPWCQRRSLPYRFDAHVVLLSYAFCEGKNRAVLARTARIRQSDGVLWVFLGYQPIDL